MLSDKALKQIDAKEFRKELGITKTDYRFLRGLILAGWDLEGMSIWSPNKDNNEKLTLPELCRLLRGIDVIYITRRQTERE